MHHTWIPNFSHWKGNNGLELQQSMRNTHVNINKWRDIGQHVTLLPNGLFVTGRSFYTDPASIAGYNEGAFAMEMLGDFDIGKDSFDGVQKESALKLAKYFYDKGRYIRFHRENADKSCPGTSIDKAVFMNEIINLKEDIYDMSNMRLPDNWNEEKYLNANPDVKAAVVAGAFKDGAAHWLAYGYREPHRYLAMIIPEVVETIKRGV